VVAARAVGGGIVVQVPAGVAPGSQAVEVTVERRHARADFPVRRLGLLRAAGAVYPFVVGADGVQAGGAALPIAGTRALRISSDGACAYLLRGRRLLVIDLGAAGGPRLLREVQLAIDAWGLAVATERVVAVGDGVVQAFDTRSARAPAPYPMAPLPDAARGARAVELDPAGEWLALLVPEGNRLVMVDFGNPARPGAAAELPLLAEARVPLVRDLRFSADGATLWVIAGDNRESLASGRKATELVAVRFERTEGVLSPSVWRSAAIAGAGAPLHLAVPRLGAVESGASIHLGPEQQPVLLTTVEPSLLDASPAAPAVGEAEGAGALVQSDATGDARTLARGPAILVSVERSPAERTAANPTGDDRLVLSSLHRSPPRLGVADALAGRPGALHETPLGPAAAEDVGAPFPVELRLQP
jgi:hypothetical protein